MSIFWFAEAVLPYIFLLFGVMVLTGNNMARRYLVTCGMSFNARRLVGASLVLGAFAMLAELTSCHVTSGVIGALVAMSLAASYRGQVRSALGSAATAASLMPIVVMP